MSKLDSVNRKHLETYWQKYQEAIIIITILHVFLFIRVYNQKYKNHTLKLSNIQIW